MTLQDETNRVVADFDFTDDDVNRHVKEFLKQMGMSFTSCSLTTHALHSSMP